MARTWPAEGLLSTPYRRDVQRSRGCYIVETPGDVTIKIQDTATYHRNPTHS